MLCHVNWFFEIYKITILVFNLVVTFVNFVVEVVSSTFVAVVVFSNSIVPIDVFGTIGFCFIKRIDLCYLVNFDIVIIIYPIFSNLD